MLNPWTPNAADVASAITQQNPWHAVGDVPESLAPRPERVMAAALAERLRATRVPRFQIILGPRRVGKTTVMYQALRHLIRAGVRTDRLVWLRLDHPVLQGVPLGTLVRTLLEERGATAEAPLHLFLDELVYAARWDLWLKTFYDEQWPVRVVGTSSATAVLRDRHVESGIGRWEEHHLMPWSFAEHVRLGEPVPPKSALAGSLAEALLTLPSTLAPLEPTLRRHLLIGGFPELLTTPRQDEASDLLRSQRTLRMDAVERALYKDIPQAFGITDPLKLERLLYVLAGQMTGILSPAKAGQTVGMSQPTVDKYVAYLERAFLVFLLPNYSASEETVQRRGRKLYFVDGAIRNAALLRGLAPLQDAGEMGLHYENAAAAHLHALARQTGVRLYHWRQKDREIDLVYDDPAGPAAFEIASSASHSTSGLRALVERYPRFEGRTWLVYPSAAPQPPTAAHDGVGRLPLAAFLYALGCLTDRETLARLAP